MKKLAFTALCCALGVWTVGCGGSKPSHPSDAGVNCETSICLPDSGPMPMDSGVDSGTVVHTDGGPGDGSTGTCQVGLACNPSRGCNSGTCVGEQDTSEGAGSMYPVMNYDASVPLIFYQGGYCTPAPQAVYQGVTMTPSPMACDPNSTTSCGMCATCIDLGPDSSGNRYSGCFSNCTPSLTEQTCDHDGQSCDLTQHVCLPYGCHSDAECRIYRPDTNGDGMIDTSDSLVYDTDSMATCNMTTFRCEQPSAAGAVAGMMCDKDSQCEQNGNCITQAGAGWPGGYCTVFGCDVSGNECPSSDVCQSHGIGAALCLQPCTVGAEATADQTGTMGHGQGCRAGYRCLWNGTGGGSNNGGCFLGNYNAITTNNVGGGCGTDADCYSPFGAGHCIDFSPDASGGYCTIEDCDAPNMPAGLCGSNAECGVLNYSGGVTQGLCLQSCTTGDDCRNGYGCFPASQAAMLGITGTTGGVCFAGCINDANCQTGQTCMGASSTALGHCTGMGTGGPDAGTGTPDAGTSADASVSG